MEFAGKDIVKLVSDRGAADDLDNAGGNDVMLQRDAQGLRVGVHPVKPCLHAREIPNRGPAAGEQFARELKPAPFGRHQHQVHVCQRLVHAFPAGQRIRLRPEVLGRNAQQREERIVLHIKHRQRAVKIIHKRGLFHTKPPRQNAHLIVPQQHPTAHWHEKAFATRLHVV
ncbi:MAG: hypothetical protein GX810_05920 [Clostridiales bacterium]|nr:hypothetical protein [Clostridiales bacterium]